ncbi:alpha/beta hydrolase [Alteribacter lacisalsi]|uniref:Alpha/beta hydrolase n=1 Tax=Alteribacter lacisalsi TaxID=2045244 RepID=A0A2W0H417_9BACI|nr:alpha/beta hydrolase [Alteribacter lacisalsi]PYZ96583.1 alpha/beta hydrolase [Alteribacter lacisalsi]
MILHTNVTGRGKPLLFLHSGLMTGEAEFPEQVRCFSSTRMVVTMDLTGHGRSVFHGELTFERMAEDVAETLDHLNIRSSDTAGVSIGALVAVHFAANAQEKVDRLILSGLFLERPVTWPEIIDQQLTKQQAMLKNNVVGAHYDQLHGENDWRRLMALTADPDWYPFRTIRSFLHRRKETLILCGEQAEEEVEMDRQAAARYGHLRFETVPGAGHLPHSDQPDLFNQAVKGYLENGSVRFGMDIQYR